MGEHREGVWTGQDIRPCPAQPNWRRLACEGGALAGGAALPFLVSPLGVALPVAAVILGFGALGLMGRHSDDRRRQGKAPVQELREEFGVGSVWKVDLMIRQGEAPTGCDEGLMWVEGGRIVFSGLRTSFALVPAQAAGMVRHDPELRGQRLRLNLPLAKETPAGPLSLSFWPIAEGFRRAENDASDLRFALNRVLDHGGSSPPELTGQWPPLGIGPGAPAPGALLARALLSPIGWTVVAAAIGSLVLTVSPWAGCLTFAVAAIGANWAVRIENVPRWRAWHDGRRARGQT